MRLAEARSVLRVEPGAGLRAVRRAYRERLLKVHPDKGGDPEEFRQVRLAGVLLLSQSKAVTPKPHKRQVCKPQSRVSRPARATRPKELPDPSRLASVFQDGQAKSYVSLDAVLGGGNNAKGRGTPKSVNTSSAQKSDSACCGVDISASKLAALVAELKALTSQERRVRLAALPAKVREQLREHLCASAQRTPGHREARAKEAPRSRCNGQLRLGAVEEPGHQDGFCGHHLLRMVSDCNTGSCSPMQTSDCQWSECSARCGEGSKQRERRILSEALAGGTACEGPLKELSICQLSQCTLVDCRWADWGAWSDCSCECGGGTKRRTRGVMEAPRNGGKECEPQDMEQAFPCNTQPCGSGCVDGQWGAWSSWTSCSATCSSSYQSRSRNLEIQPSSCGKAAAGPRDEYQVCSNLEPCIQDTDCQLHDWGEWSHCSCHCFGIRERT
eukprot:s1887_g4.t1